MVGRGGRGPISSLDYVLRRTLAERRMGLGTNTCIRMIQRRIGPAFVITIMMLRLSHCRSVVRTRITSLQLAIGAQHLCI